MRYKIVLAPEAVQDLKRVRAHLRAMVRDAIEKHLRHQVTRTSRSGVKRLRGVSRPQYRLRVGVARIFCDVSEDTVEVLAVVFKSEADAWLRRGGDPT